MLNPVASSQGFKSSSLSEYSMVVHGAGPSHGVATVESKATNNANDVGVTFPKLPVLASNPLAEPDELDKFESPKGTLPTQVYPTLTTVHPGIGLKSAAFLNQGDSEDSDEEVRQLFCVHVAHGCCSRITDSYETVCDFWHVLKRPDVKTYPCVQFNF